MPVFHMLFTFRRRQVVQECGEGIYSSIVIVIFYIHYMPLCVLLCGPKIRNKDLVFLYSTMLYLLNITYVVHSTLLMFQRCIAMRRF